MTALSRRDLISAAGAALQASASPESADAARPAREPGLAFGWREAVVVVANSAPWVEVLTAVGGWEVAHAEAADASLNALWSLPPDAQARQTLMRNKGTRSGFVRLVEVSGAAQQRIRPDDQAWKTGGVQALDMRVVDMEATREALQARGWRAPSDPVEYEAYAGIRVLQWAPSSPDGVRLSLIQRLAPPLTGWPELERWSRAANAAITVKDLALSSRFFGGLGLRPAGRSATVGAGGPNVMGLPWTFQRSLPVEIVGFVASMPGEGAVELISMPLAQGRDHGAAAHPPNLGVAGLRFVVEDAAALAAGLLARGTPLTSALQRIKIAPYGDGRAFAVRAPDGVWLEFFQPVA